MESVYHSLGAPRGHRSLWHWGLGFGLALGLGILGLVFLGPVYAPDVMNLAYPQALSLDLEREFVLPHLFPSANQRSSSTVQEWMETVRSQVQQTLGSTSVGTADCSVYPPGLKLTERYAPLASRHSKLLIAANFRNSQQVLPTTIEQLLQLTLFLGPQNVHVSIYENDSSDMTRELLKIFQVALEKIGSKSLFNLTDDASDYKGRNRIDVLAGLRNLALAPLYRNGSAYDQVLFINDVFFCADDILELLHQHQLQSADLTCGIDYWKPKLAYYDTWVGRSMSGNLLTEFVMDSMFPKDMQDRQRFLKGFPIQVFSCWNGMALMNPKPYTDHGVRFRSAFNSQTECAASECQLISKDFWKFGYGRILMVPSVGFVYHREYQSASRALKWKLFETSGRFARNSSIEHNELVQWQYPGPEKVVCYPLEGTNNPQTNWGKPIWEKMTYAPIPRLGST